MAEDRMYLTVDKEKRQPQNDGYIAVISQGSPQRGDENILVLDVTIVQSHEEASAWFDRQCHERPWEQRT
jgi:hypothetical protein